MEDNLEGPKGTVPLGHFEQKIKAAFFDRDGVLNIDKEYLHCIEELEWVDGAKEAVAYLTKEGYTVFVVTNQSGIARGFYTVEDMQKLHDYISAEIEEACGSIAKFYFCPHLPEGKVKEYANTTSLCGYLLSRPLFYYDHRRKRSVKSY